MKLILVATILVLVVGFIGECQGQGRLWNIGRKAFGSGKPALHFRNLPNRKAAENAARNAGKGNKPVEHSAPKTGGPHYHPADKKGNIIKNGAHYGYPKRKG